MHYLSEHTEQVLDKYAHTQRISVIDDIVASWDYLGTVLEGKVDPNDIILMSSLDGS